MQLPEGVSRTVPAGIPDFFCRTFLFFNLVFSHVDAGHLTPGFPHSFPDLIHQGPIRKYFFQSTHAFASKPFVLTS